MNTHKNRTLNHELVYNYIKRYNDNEDIEEKNFKNSIKELLTDFPASIVCTKEIYDEICYVYSSLL